MSISSRDRLRFLGGGSFLLGGLLHSANIIIVLALLVGVSLMVTFPRLIVVLLATDVQRNQESRASISPQQWNLMLLEVFLREKVRRGRCKGC